MALTIYGSPRSRTMRTLWVAAELGLTYRHVPLAWDDPALEAPEFLRLNPAGTIPTIVDDGFALAESLAINLYLTKKYGGGAPTPLYPTSPEGEAEVWRWSLWAQAHLEPWVQRDGQFEAIRRSAGEAMNDALAASLARLDLALAGRRWLVGGDFSVADLNVAAVLSPTRAREISLVAYPHVGEWLAACYDRPAARATRRRFA
jgi:glutathione S-transferase